MPSVSLAGSPHKIIIGSAEELNSPSMRCAAIASHAQCHSKNLTMVETTAREASASMEVPAIRANTGNRIALQLSSLASNGIYP